MLNTLAKAALTIIRPLICVNFMFHIILAFSVSANASTPDGCGVGPCPEQIVSGVLAGAAINSLGEVVWSQQDGQSPSQIFSSIRGQLTNDPWGSRYSPAINNLGDLVWVESSNGYPNGYILRGTIAGQPVTVATSETNWIGNSDINDRGEVVWVQQDGQNYYQIHSSVRGQLTSGAYYYDNPSINKQGDVIFTRSDTMLPSSWQVYKISAGSTTPVAVTSDNLDHRRSAINDSGEIVWVEWDGNPGSAAKIVSSVRGVLAAASNIWSIDLNNCGEVVYVTYENGQNTLYRLGNSASCVTYPAANESQEQAFPVNYGDIFTGLMDGTTNPVDWYRFYATAGDNIHITVNFDNRPPNVLAIGLYDGQGNLVSGPTTTSPLGIHITAGGYGGSYFLKVEAQGGRFGYAVSLSKYSNNCGVGPCPEVISSAPNAGNPAINSLGEVVWVQYNMSGDLQIFSSTRGQVTTDPAQQYSPAINNLGDLVWAEMNYNTTPTYSIRGTIAGQPVIIATSESNSFGKVDLNDRGEVVWSQRDGNNSGQIFSSLRGQLTNGSFFHESPSINNNGDIVFYIYDLAQPETTQIYMLATGSTTPVVVTSGNLYRRSPVINDGGDIVWVEQETDSPSSVAKIISISRGELLQVPGINSSAIQSWWRPIYSVDMNNCGYLVYNANVNGQNGLYRQGRAAPCIATPERLFTLTVGKNSASTGTGQVSSIEEGISLASTETMKTAAFLAGTMVTLTATPDVNSVFSGWSGACSGTAACQVTMDAAKNVLVIFETKPADTTPPLTTATPAGGTYSSSQSVVLTCSDSAGSGCATTWYCLGSGCTPTTPYEGAITISISTHLRFYSTDVAGNNEAIKISTYTILAADYALNLTMAGTGTGMVVSTPTGMAGNSNSSTRFSGGETVILRATPSSYSDFSYWSGDCTGTADCILTMTADRWVTATFTKDTMHSTYIPNGGGIYSPTIQAAYNAAANSDIIRLWGIDFIEDIVCMTDKQVTISGGYNDAFTTQDGMTTLHGSLTISSGTVTIEMVGIQ